MEVDMDEQEVLLDNDDEEANDPDPELPLRFREAIFEKLDGFGLRLVFKKRLQECDVDPLRNRFTIPLSKLEVAYNFLTDLERRRGVLKVMVVGPGLRRTRMGLKMVKIGRSRAYVLCKNWYKDIVVANKLRVRDVIQVWFFRDSRGQPCFALVIMPRLLPSSVGDLVEGVSSLSLN